ncbi:MAG: FecR domain-containing protein [Acidobacteria bacterium]|nr:FecR domain-containing protein [Acidobacteriota bacterium]
MKPAIMKAMVVMGALAASMAGAEDEGSGRGVARISVIHGDVSVRRGDAGEWIAAAINAPLVVQDGLYTGPLSRAELQFDFANMIRLDESSEVRLSELEYQRYQIQVARGTATFRVLRDSRADVEISTPNVSVRPAKKGSYRITVRPDGSSEITVRSGEAEVFTPRGSERLTSGRTMLARGTASDPEYQIAGAVRSNDFDRWNERRDRDLERTRSYQYVSSDIYGAEDLDGHGDWIYAPPYGWVWRPYSSGGWAPYRHGRWAWVDWYGWSWVSYDPWGWAPYHYGRWFNHGNRWCWWPGAMHSRHHWSPGLVAFFGWGGHHGGIGVGIGFGNMGWVPLAPYEPYYPWYGSRYYAGYRNRSYVDNSVHVVNNINITNIYRNSRVTNGVTAVSAGDFTRGRGGNTIHVSENDLRGAGLVRGQVPLAPERESLRLADREVRGAAIPRETGNTRFYSRREPAKVDRVGFDEQRRGIEQVSRRTFGEGRTAEGAPAGGRVANAESRREASPARSEGDTNATRSWRRVSEPERGEAGVRGAEPRSREENGWRRFGGGTPERGTDTRRAETAPRTETPARGGRESSDGWRRFEGPSRNTESAPRTEAPARGRSEMPSYEGRRSGSPPSRVESAPRSEPRESRRSEPQSIRISPPIVRERSAPPPTYQDRGSMGRGSESRPQMSAPQRSAPEMSAPRGSGGGGRIEGGGGARGESRSPGRSR